MTEKQEVIKLHHSSDEKAKVTATEDQAVAYLQSGWVKTEAESK